ncbi:MAG: hypothetical protein ABIR24_00150 [Verrucomicrobiota bacterium]
MPFLKGYQKRITGDEKGQAQIFLDRLFQGFGLQGSLDVGGSPEFRVLKSAEDGGGTSFADYVWKPVVLIEMKKRGENLQKHYRQPITGRASCRTVRVTSCSATSMNSGFTISTPTSTRPKTNSRPKLSRNAGRLSLSREPDHPSNVD